ncbi:hypothetical protein HY745_01995, partial [Candidatus Desantisbacteria bacterium]|nr:hypothetical protein [Candidatus Desantisbacteria bacterium]
MLKKLQIIIVFSVLLLSSIMIFANMDCPKEKACSPEMHKKGMKMMTTDITGCMFCMK